MKIHIASQQLHLEADAGIPNLHPETVSRLQKAYMKGVVAGANDLRSEALAGAAPVAPAYNHLESMSAQRREGRFSDLHC